MKRRELFPVVLSAGIAIALVVSSAGPVWADGGAGKSIQVMNIYQSPGATLVASDAAKLARYYMFFFNRNRYYQIAPDTYTAVRALNPDTLIFNYQQGPDTWLDQDGSNVLNVNNIVRYNNTYGHSMGNLNTDNPGFFLLNSSAQRINTYYDANRRVLDFGSADFQAYWLEATEHDVVDQPWRPDGIFVDNCMVTYPSYFCERPAKYPTDASWTTAMLSWHKALAAGLHARGIKLWTNSDPVSDADGYAAWLAIDADPDYPDWLNSEGTFCHKWGTAACTFYDETKWKRQVDVMVNMVNCGAAMFSHVDMVEGGSGTDNYGRALSYWDALWYAMGSYLLGKNDARGNDVFYFSNDVNKYYKLYWYDEYHQIDVGDAMGNYTVTNYGGRNIYWREFTKGYVYVNPSTGDAPSIPLPESCKQLSHATINDDPATFGDVTSISLDSHRGAILLKSSQFVIAEVVGRQVFYNNCYFDGNDPAANAGDDGAIATDKTALLPDGTATFANYTSYARGINGVMVDIADPAGTPTVADFAFKVGNDNDPGAWPTAPAPTSVTVRPGAGASGSDRVTIIWPDNAIEKQWLEVTVLVTANTGLTDPDVFYFGNAIGETGNSASDAEVTPTDEVGVRNNPHTLGGTPAAIDDAYDFNRDRKVSPTDQIVCRNNGTSGPTALQLIVLIVNQPPTADAGPDDSITWPTNLAYLDGTVSDDGYPLPATLTTTWSKVSGPGGVIFGNASAVDTTATFSAAGPYVLQLEAHDGELSDADTVQIDVVDLAGIFFEDDFDDNNLDGWTTLAGNFETFQFLSEPGYEVHPTLADSRMRADLTNPSLSDTVYISFKIRHTYDAPPGGGGTGWKQGRIWLVNDAGDGFGLYFALVRDTGSGTLDLYTTTGDGATETPVGAYSAPPDPGDYELQQIELVYNRLTDQVECFYEGASMGTRGISSSYRDFTRVVVYLKTPYVGEWGQLDIDDIHIANSP